jgi:GH35 family endo-1,4-beta-xylanase
MDRREFLAMSAAAGALAFQPALREAEPRTKRRSREPSNEPQIRVLMVEADGSPLDEVRAKTLCARDLANDPLPQRMVSASGRTRIVLPKEPIQVSLRLKVPNFGEVHCWADNGGHGYSGPMNVKFVVDAAATRLRRVREAHELAKKELVTLDPPTEKFLKVAAQPVTDERTAYTALAAGLHAGERISLARARNRISRFPRPRKDFLFGCMISPYDRLGPKFESAVRQRFNLATANWYTWGPEQPVEKRIDYARMDGSIRWCLERDITPKTFGYCYMATGATPEWLRKWPFEKMLPEYERVVRQTMQRYTGKAPFAEIINEAHDKANIWNLSQSQIVELTKAVCRAAREGSPTVKRMINNCCQWGEYARKSRDDGSRAWTPYLYITDCVAAGVDFDVLGLQLYYPQIDVLEIERSLDRFKKFNKPIHITEIATASADGPDLKSMRPKTTAPGWHGPWSEETQAEWLEAIYTLVYSRPEYEAIGWWDLADVGGHFWPHGGLLHADLTPKLAYERLGELQKAWGVAPRA